MAAAAPGRRLGVIYGGRLGSRAPVAGPGGGAGGAHARSCPWGSTCAPLASLTPRGCGGELGRFGHDENSGSVKALAAAGERVFSAHQDGRVRVWRVSRRSRSENAFKLVAALPTARDYLGRVFRQASYVQTTARRSHRRLWIEHADSISCLAVAATVHDAALLYSGSWDRTLKVWRIADLKCLEYIRAHDDTVNAVAAGAGVIYSGSADGCVKAWEKGKASHFLQGVLVARDGVSWYSLFEI